MTRLIKHLCRCDPDRPGRLQFIFKAWAAYLGLLFLGGAVFCAPLYVWFDRYVTDVRGQYQDENQRMQDINRQLLLIIEKRLPAIADKVDEAAQTARSAATTASGAARTAGHAGSTAREVSSSATRAATTAKGAASNLDRALNPPPAPPKDVPDWLSGK